jgi:hypothetical protein
MFNSFLTDATFCFKRASVTLGGHMELPELYDATVYYAFGIEKLCKAIVHDVNPVFLLENQKFENAAAILYADRLLPISPPKAKTDKDLNRNLLPFKASMLMAARFCQAVEDHIGLFTELADLRGIVAHRSVDEMDIPTASRFLVRTFQPTIEILAKALDFDAADCFVAGQRKTLAEASEAILGHERFAEKIKARVQIHHDLWEQRKVDLGALDEAQVETIDALQRRYPGLYQTATDCPVCGQQAVLYYKFIDRVIEDAIATVGQYALRLQCHFCEMYVQGYGEVDYFKLNEKLRKGND